MTDEVKMKVRERPSVMIGTPMYGGMCTGTFALGMLLTAQRLRDAGINVGWCQMANESLITRGRNEIVRRFLSSSHDYLMFIDADIGFGPDAVLALLEADKDIVCGIYPKKEVNWESVERAAKEGKKDLADYAGAFVFGMETNVAETDANGLIEIRHGGTGFMLINRSVFETLAPHVSTYRVSNLQDPVTGEFVKPLTHEFFATSIDPSGALLSEDYHFCDLFRAHGGKVYANPFIRLTHTGTYVYDGDILKSGGNLK